MFFLLTDTALFAQFQVGLQLLKLLLFASSLWLIFLILIQRGKGGGLSAALGGGGGDSAFGAKAGDAFTKITIFSAIFWIGLCMVTIAWYNPPERASNRFAEDEEYSLNDDDGGGMSTPSMGAVGEQGDAAGDSADDAESSEDAGSSLEPAVSDAEPAESDDDDAAADDAADGGGR